jgi:hypothetical protein
MMNTNHLISDNTFCECQYVAVADDLNICSACACELHQQKLNLQLEDHLSKSSVLSH